MPARPMIFLAEVISEHPARFQGLAAVPLQDPGQALPSATRRGGPRRGGPGQRSHAGSLPGRAAVRPFWETLQDLGGVALYIHPNPVPV